MKKYYEEWKRLNTKKNLTGVQAMEAVKQDGYALRYVQKDIFTKHLVEVTIDGEQFEISKESARSFKESINNVK